MGSHTHTQSGEQTGEQTEHAERELDALFAQLGPANPPHIAERRRAPRERCRAIGSIRVVGITRANTATPIVVFDANNYGIGFFTRGPIVANADATATVVFPDGQVRGLDGTIIRARLISPGWYQAALLFLHPKLILQHLKPK